MIRKLFVVSAIFFMATALAFAQRGGGGGGDMGGGGGGMGGGGGFGGGRGGGGADKLNTLATELKLLPAQQTALIEIFDAAQNATKPLIQQATAEQNVMVSLEIKGQDSAGEVAKLAAIRSQIKMIEVDAFNKTLAKLDDKQKQKAAKLYELMEGMFSGQNWRRS